MSRGVKAEPVVTKYAEIANGTDTPYLFEHAQDNFYRRPGGGRIHLRDVAAWALEHGLGKIEIKERVR